MKILDKLLFAVITVFAASQIHAQTHYEWKGYVDSDFTNSANWKADPGQAPYTGTFADSRLQVYNAANSPLYYTADLGHTIYQNNDSGGRTLFVGSGNSGAMYITGGIFEGQSAGSDGISYNADGTLVIDGGSYLKVVNSTGFNVKYGGTGTGTLTVSNGLFEVGTVVVGGGPAWVGDAKGIINLDGGTTRVDRIYASSSVPDGAAIINFNGGLLVPHQAESSFLHGFSEANILEGGMFVDTAGHSVTINQDLQDGGSGGELTKQGAGRVNLGGTNSFTGDVTVEEGYLRVYNNAALGTTDGSTTVKFGASLELVSNVTVTNESLTIYGKMSSYGALASPSGDNTWAGDILIGQNDSRVTANSGCVLRMSGVIDDGPNDYNVEFRGSGTGVMVVSGENTYGGKTEIVVATLRIDGGDNRLPTDTELIIGNSSNVESATFDLNGFNQEVALLDDLGTTMTNTVMDSAGGGSLTVNDSGNRTFAGNFVGPMTLVKTNSNVLTLDGDMQATSIAVNQGTVQGSATWHCLFNGSDTPNQLIVTNGTLDISSMTFDFDENTPVEAGVYVIADYSAGGTLQANATAPFFADSVDLPEFSSFIHDTDAKQILFVSGLEGTVILVQ